MNYHDFLKKKLITAPPSGFTCDRSSLPANLYDYQKDLDQWALQRGKAALFTMTGTI